MIKLASTNQSPLKRPKIQRPACRPFNSITMPRLKPQDQKQQLSKSSLLLVSNPISNGHDNANRCSSSTPANADYFQFSKLLLECKSFFEKEKRSLIVVEKPQKRDSQIPPCFEKFSVFINDQRFLLSLPSNYLNDLITAISTILDSINNQTIPSFLVYADFPIYMKFTLFEEMSIVYNILSTVLDTIDPENLKPFIITDLIKKIIKILNIPDMNERKILEGIVLQIATFFPQQRPFILNCLFNLLQDQIDDLIPFFCVGSVLQCISNILSLPEVKLTKCQLSIILHMFSSYFLDKFAYELDNVLKKLYILLPDFSEKVRTFLIFNWPNKDSQNSYYFLSFYLSSLFRSAFMKDDNGVQMGFFIETRI